MQRLPSPPAAVSIFALGALCVLLLAGPARSAPTGDAAAPGQEVVDVFIDQLEAAGIPGGAFVTVTTDGTIVTRGVGVTGDGKPVTDDTPFVIGSTTKSFTALAILQLVDAGKVDLDAPVVDYVPELQLPDGEPVRAITVRHLLQHTSGLDDLTGGAVLASAREGTALEAVGEVSGARLASTPGETWRYANVNYVLAGLVVERASGLAYPVYVEETILDPLGMSDTHVLAHPSVAPGHRYWFGLPVAHGPVQHRGVGPAGYIASTARDLGSYLAMHLREGRALDGTRIVSARAVRDLTAPGPQAHLGPWAGDATARYAMGWMVGGPWEEPAVFHPGNAPDSSAMIALFPGRGLAAATLVPAAHELPVPGNPSLTDRISRNALHAVLGEPVPAATGRWGFYALFDLAAVALIGVAAWAVLRAVRARRHVAVGLVRRWLQPLPTLLVSAVLMILPWLTAYGWDGVWTWAPDLAVLLTVLIALTASAAGIRILTAAQQSRDQRAPTGPAEPGPARASAANAPVR
jgi:CubicO group peptidase (beta-lactamase class C family)